MLAQRITLEGNDIDSRYEIAPEYYLETIPAEGVTELQDNLISLGNGNYRVTASVFPCV